MKRCGLRTAQIRKWRLMILILCSMALILPIMTFPYLVKENERIRIPSISKNLVEGQLSNNTFNIGSSSTRVTSILRDHLPRRNFTGRTTADPLKGIIDLLDLTSRTQEPLQVDSDKFPEPKQITNVSVTSRNVTSAPNELPELLLKLRPQFLKDVPRNYSSEYKNPCYFTKDGRIHCLPYYFLVGMPKSGTTDMFNKISLHPHIVEHEKESHWWARWSMGRGRHSLQRFVDNTFTNYLLKRIKGGGDPKRIVIGDGSPSTFWDVSNWKTLYPEYRASGPPYIVADFIQTLLPNSKHLVSFRDPTPRLYSDYNYLHDVGGMLKTPEFFHKKVQHSISTFSACLKERSLRGCTYEAMVDFNNAKKDHIRLWVGIYDVFTKDWLERFPREQFMAIKMEEWSSNCTKVLPEIYKFLDIADLPAENISRTCSGRKLNVQMKKFRPMLSSTKRLLRDFYRPYVKELARVLQDDKFLWDY